MREIIITVQEEGQRLDRYLYKYLPNASTGFLHKMMRKKNIKRNQEKVSGNEKLQAGDQIQIYFSEETMKKFGAPSLKKDTRPDDRDRPDDNPPGIRQKHDTSPAVTQRKYDGRSAGKQVRPDGRTGGTRGEESEALRRQVRILFQNDDILILHKPAGMLTQKARADGDSLNDYLYDYWRGEIMKGKDLPASFRPSVANRLDRNTSGIVMCGITLKGLQMLSALLKNRDVEKYYLCIVKGQVTEGRKINGYLRKDEKKNRVSLHKEPVPGSTYIETAYEPVSIIGNNKFLTEAGNKGSLSEIKEMSLLRVKLITGKSHQIRAHLAAIGHPILGDPKYGDPRINQILEKKGIHHQLLHSSELYIPADAEGITPELKGLHIIDEMPEDFKI